MEKRGEIKRQSFDLTVPDFFMLNSTNKLKGFDRFKHEIGGGDLFVAFYPHISAWSFEPTIGTERGDRGMILNDKKIFFEVDRCTEGLSIIEQKIDNYIRYANQSGERFYVVFSILETDRLVTNRGNNLIPIIRSKRRGDQFLIVNHNNLIQDPLGELLYSPRDEIFSVKTLD